jgi:hypothetical protein
VTAWLVLTGWGDVAADQGCDSGRDVDRGPVFESKSDDLEADGEPVGEAAASTTAGSPHRPANDAQGIWSPYGRGWPLTVMRPASTSGWWSCGNAVVLATRKTSAGVWDGVPYTADEWISEIWAPTRDGWRCALSQSPQSRRDPLTGGIPGPCAYSAGIH